MGTCNSIGDDDRFPIPHFYILHFGKWHRNPAILRFNSDDRLPFRISRIDGNDTSIHNAIVIEWNCLAMIRHAEHIPVDEFGNLLPLRKSFVGDCPFRHRIPGLIFKSIRLLGR